MRTTFHVRTGKGTLVFNEDGSVRTFADSIGLASRAVRQHAGWQSVRYASKRYALRGGIRTPEWINLALPLQK